MMKKSVVVLLGIILLFSVCACKKNEPKDDPGTVADPNHSATVEVTNDLFVADGQSSYRIVYPEDASSYEKSAANLIADYIELATGVRLIGCSESVASYGANSRYIMVGDTAAAKTLGVDYSADTLTSQGFKIVTEGYNTFLLGGGDIGTLFAGYEFLKCYIDWDCVAVDEINYLTTSALTFKKLNIVEIPDIEYRVSGDRQTYDSFSVSQLLKLITAYGHGFIAVNGRVYHNCFEYLPANLYNDPSKEETYHPSWYSGPATDNNTAQNSIQLCYSANGDPEEYELMLDTCLETLVSAVKANSDINNIQFSMADNLNWCSCDKCKEYHDKYGTNSAVVIRFCNDLHDKFEEYAAANGMDRKINIVFFAYHETIDAPVSVNADGTYSLIDGLKCKDGVSVFYAPVYADYTKDFVSSTNYNYYETMKKWALVSKDLYLWLYGTNFQNYLIPYGNFDSMQENIRIAKELNVNYLFIEGQHYSSTGHPSGFTYLKEYLQSELMWNVNADVASLTDHFFEDYFKTAAEPMRRYYEELRTNFDYMYRVAGAPCGIFNNVKERSYWQEGMLRGWLNDIDEAYEAIYPLKKTDVEVYDKVKNRIRIESVSVRYLFLSLYGDTTNVQHIEMMRELKADLVDLGFTEAGQGSSVDGVWSGWPL